MVGTACYLAPEQVTGAPVGPPADIYALGLVLLECLSGHTEYEGTEVEVAVARLSRPPTVPAEHGPSWQQLLTAMTDYHPSNRPDAMDCARRLHDIAQTASADTARRDTGRSGVPRVAVPDTEDAGLSTTEMSTARRQRGRTSTRLPRVGKVPAGLGAAGAAGVVLTALMLTTPAGTAGEPIPESAPGQSPTVLSPDNDREQHGQAPVITDKTPAPITKRSPHVGGVNSPKATAAAPAQNDKPKHRGKARNKSKADVSVGKPAKAK
jgi:serine/threonine protein kinase